MANIAPRHGGPSTAVHHMCASLAARGHDVDLVTTDADGVGGVLDVSTGHRTPERNGYGIWYERTGTRWTSWQASPALGNRLEKLIPLADIVEIHSLYLYHTWKSSRVAMEHAVPYVIRPHGSLNRADRRRHLIRKQVYEYLIEDRTLAHASAFHCTSPSETQQLPDRMRSRAYTIPHGVDESLFDLANGEGRPTVGAILFLARIAPKKGLDILLRALYILRLHGVDARLTVAGAGHPRYERQIIALVEKLGLNHCVKFVGHADEEARAALLSSHDVLALPSQDENFGIAVAEALAAGLPVVITPGVALSEYVAGSAAGCVVNRDPQSVADGIGTILADESSQTHRRRAATALAKRHFRWEVAGELMEQMYLECTRDGTS